MATATIRIPISKSVADGVALKVFGFGSMAVDESGRLIVDHHNDVIEPAELERAAYEFTKSARQLDVMHDRDPIGALIESLYLSPEKAEAMGVGAVKSHGWWTGFEVRDPETIARVKAGELAELSIDCVAERWTDEPATKQITKRDDPTDPNRPIGRLRNLKITMLSLVDRGAGKGVKVALWKRREKMMDPITIEMIMAKLSPEEQAALEAIMSAPKAEAPMVPAPDGSDTPAAKALAKRLADNESEIQKMREERDLEREITKARAEGLDFVAGVSLEEIAKLRLGSSKESRPKLDAILKSAAEAIKVSGLLKTHGAVSTGAGAGSTFDDLYEAEKAKRPDVDPSTLVRELSKRHPDLYRTRGKN